MTEKDFINLSSLLRKEEKLLKSRITPRYLLRAHQDKLAYIKLIRKEIAAFVALWPTADKEWFELGTLWVDPEHRHKGLASELFALCEKEGGNKNMFLITRSMKVVHLAETHGWEEVEGDWRKDKFWKNICEPWDALPKSGSRLLPKEGRLFFKKR